MKLLITLLKNKTERVISPARGVGETHLFSNFSTTLLTLITVLVITFCQSTQKEEQVKNSGWVESQGEGTSENDALENAKVEAIKSKVGEQITGKSTVVNAQLESGSVQSFFKGYVSQVKVIEKGKNKGLFTVRILCYVDEKEFNNYMENVLISKSRPRFMTLIEETNLGKKITPESGEQSSTEAALSSKLNDLGFDFVQRTGTVINLLKKQKGNLSLAAQGNSDLAKKIGTEVGTEFVIIGTVQIEEKEKPDSKLKTVHSTLNLKIVDVGTGAIVASGESYGGDASSNPKFASMNSVSYGVDELLNGTKGRPSIIRQMLKKWNPGSGSEIQLSLEISDFAKLDKFTTMLEDLNNKIVSVDSKGFKKGNSLVVVFYRGTSMDLLKNLTNDEMIKKDFKITVKQQTASQVFLRVN